MISEILNEAVLIFEKIYVPYNLNTSHAYFTAFTGEEYMRRQKNKISVQ